MLTDPLVVLEQAQSQLSPVLVGLLGMVEMRDSYTHAHGARVAFYTLRIAHMLRLTNDQCRDAYTAGLIHDIGKIRIPATILHKDGPLTPSERRTMETHAAMSSLITALHYPYLAPAVRAHHEHWDGSGYPDGLAGEKIPLLGRIISVADGYDAITTNRPYRPGIPSSEAQAILQTYRGRQWDGTIVDAFLEALKQDGAAGITQRRSRPK